MLAQMRSIKGNKYPLTYVIPTDHSVFWFNGGAKWKLASDLLTEEISLVRTCTQREQMQWLVYNKFWSYFTHIDLVISIKIILMDSYYDN